MIKCYRNSGMKIYLYRLYFYTKKRTKREHKVNILIKKENKKRTFFYTKREHFFDTYNLNEFWESKNLVERYPTEKILRFWRRRFSPPLRLILLCYLSKV